MSFHPPFAALAVTSLGVLLSLSCVDRESDLGEPNPVITIALHPSAARIEPGQTLTLSPTLRDARRFTVTGRDVTWASSNPPVATVAGGLVTGLREGTAVISATVDGISGTARITVATSVASVEIEPESPAIAVGTSVQLHATPRAAGGSPVESEVIYWSTSDRQIASVSVGKVRGLRLGTAEITALAGEATGTTTVTVLPNISGAWILSTSFSDTARAIHCSSTGALTIEQDGSSLGGTQEQTGSCTGPGLTLDLSGSSGLRDGVLSPSRMEFLAAGVFGCSYVGELSGARPESAAGGVRCSGELAGEPATLQGTWEMRR